MREADDAVLLPLREKSWMLLLKAIYAPVTDFVYFRLHGSPAEFANFT
jgi:hypothetical protein